MADSEKTSHRVGSKASNILRSPAASKAAKSVAGSALSQAKTNEVTSPKVALKAAKILDDGRSSAKSKSVAGSVLTQKPRRK